jgi:hypothetical protein
MTTAQKAQLVERAYRILTDGRRHSLAARSWAERELGMPEEDRDELERRSHRFTPAEVLLANLHAGVMA